jgi:hypothetical protein
MPGARPQAPNNFGDCGYLRVELISPLVGTLF